MIKNDNRQKDTKIAWMLKHMKQEELASEIDFDIQIP